MGSIYLFFNRAVISHHAVIRILELENAFSSKLLPAKHRSWHRWEYFYVVSDGILKGQIEGGGHLEEVGRTL